MIASRRIWEIAIIVPTIIIWNARGSITEELEIAAEGSVKGIVRQEEILGFYRQYYVETMNHEHIIVRTDRNIKVEAGKEVQFRVK